MLFLKLSLNLLLALLNRATFRVAGGLRMPLSEEEAALSDGEQGQEVKRSFSYRADNTDGQIRWCFPSSSFQGQTLADPSCSSDTDNTLHWPDR